MACVGDETFGDGNSGGVAVGGDGNGVVEILVVVVAMVVEKQVLFWEVVVVVLELGVLGFELV